MKIILLEIMKFWEMNTEAKILCDLLTHFNKKVQSKDIFIKFL